MMRIAKVRITDHRPPGAGKSSPLEAARSTRDGGLSGLDRLERLQKEEAANADKWVSGLSPVALQGLWKDMAGEYAHDRKDPLQRWKMAKKAAVGRAIQKLRTS